MINENGIDVDYFNRQLKKIQRNISSYTHDELARELVRLSKVADKKVSYDNEFTELDFIKAINQQPISQFALVDGERVKIC